MTGSIINLLSNEPSDIQYVNLDLDSSNFENIGTELSLTGLLGTRLELQ
jgi:hypothetical protein